MVLTWLSNQPLNDKCCHPSCLQFLDKGAYRVTNWHTSWLVYWFQSVGKVLTSHSQDRTSARYYITSPSWHNTSVRYHGYHMSQLFMYKMCHIWAHWLIIFLLNCRAKPADELPAITCWIRQLLKWLHEQS